MDRIGSKISPRELVMVAILIVLVIVLVLVYNPMGGSDTALDTEKADLQTELETKEAAVLAMNSMQAKVNAVKAEKGDNLVGLPEYSNVNNVISNLNEIFVDTDNFSMTVGEETVEDGIVNRKVQISYTMPTLDRAIFKIQCLYYCGYKYLVQDTAITSAQTEDDESWTVNLVIKVFEVAA